MSPMSLFLAHLLALQPASATTCDIFDSRCKAERSLQRAKATKNGEHRARYLFHAHHFYLELFDQTKDPSAVCEARRAFDASVAVANQSADQRASFMADLEKLVSRERKAGVRCQKTPKRPAADPPRVAKKPATTTVAQPNETPTPDVTATSNAGETPALTTTTTATTSHAPEPDPLLPVTGGSLAARETPRDPEGGRSSPQSATAPAPRDAGRNADRPTGETPWRSPVPQTTPRRGNELLIAGGVTLSVGLGLTAAAGVMGGSMLNTWRESRALHEEAGPYGTVEQADRHAALERDYDRQRPLMVATAVIGVSTLVVGAVLTGVGAKRLARATSRAMLLPAPGGLVLRARF